MKILGYIGTYNEAIDRCLQGLLRQTYPLDEVVIVDNASTHFTPPTVLPKQVTLLRNSQNLGPSGAISRGIEYALEHGYDWVWIFDADSVPRDDALERLVGFYRALAPVAQRQIGILSCSKVLTPTDRVFLGRRLTPSGPRLPEIVPDLPYCECDAVIWSGSLFNLQAVRKVGLPRHGSVGYWEDLGHDYGDVEFSYAIRKSGYRVLVHRFSIVDHPVGEGRGIRVLGRSISSTNHPAGRRYLYFRNLAYFWFHLYPRPNRLGLGIWLFYRLSITACQIVLIEEQWGPKLRACLRGVWDGLRKRLSHRYH